MASSIFSYSPISTFKSPISRRTTLSNPSPPCVKLTTNSGRMMMSSTTVSGLDNPSPCLMLPPTLEGVGGSMSYNFYDLAQNKVINFNNNKIPGKSTRIVGSSHGWLALYNERSSNLILTNPVTRRHVKLPPTSKSVSKVVISCDPEQDECQAMMIRDYSDLYFCRLGRNPTDWTPFGSIYRPHNYNFRRCDLVYSSRHKLFFCVTKLANFIELEGWDVASDPPRLCLSIQDDGLVFLENTGDQLLDANAIRLLERVTFKYLVCEEQADEVFLLTRTLERQAVEGDDIYPYKTVAFNFYTIDCELEGEGGEVDDGSEGEEGEVDVGSEGEEGEVDDGSEGEGGEVDDGSEGEGWEVDDGSLGGLAVFVGLNHSFAVSATEANGLKPDSIYFTDDRQLPLPKRWVSSMKYGGHDTGIFDYKNKTFSSCYFPSDLQSFERIMPPPIWFTPSRN